MLLSATAGGSNGSGMTSGRRAARAASNGGVANPAQNTTASSSPTGRGSAASVKAAARTRSAVTITVRRGQRTLALVSSCPGPSHGTSEAVVTKPVIAGDPVRP